MRMKQLLMAALMATTFVVVPAFGQEGQPRQAASRQGAPDHQNMTPQFRLLDFKGGTLAKFIDTLREVAGDQQVVNIIVPEKAKALPVPELQLREIDLYTALRAAEPVGPVLHDGTYYEWSAGRLAGEGAPVYVIELRSFSAGHPAFKGEQTPPEVQKHTAVHTITELTTGTGAMSADDVLSAIQAALAIEGADDETKIRYHEETGLIFARVTPDQGSVIELTLSNLQRSMRAREQGSRRSQIQQVLDMTNTKTTEELITRVNYADEMRHRVLDLQRTIAQLKDQIIKLQAELDRRRDDEPGEGGD